jgi:hypothetical protein
MAWWQGPERGFRVLRPSEEKQSTGKAGRVLGQRRVATIVTIAEIAEAGDQNGETEETRGKASLAEHIHGAHAEAESSMSRRSGKSSGCTSRMRREARQAISIGIAR